MHVKIIQQVLSRAPLAPRALCVRALPPPSLPPLGYFSYNSSGTDVRPFFCLPLYDSCPSLTAVQGMETALHTLLISKGFWAGQSGASSSLRVIFIYVSSPCRFSGPHLVLLSQFTPVTGPCRHVLEHATGTPATAALGPEPSCPSSQACSPGHSEVPSVLPLREACSLDNSRRWPPI